MSNENKIDNEKHFPALDAGKPTEDWERFDRDLMSYLGGKADKSGSSPAAKRVNIVTAALAVERERSAGSTWSLAVTLVVYGRGACAVC